MREVTLCVFARWPALDSLEIAGRASERRGNMFKGFKGLT